MTIGLNSTMEEIIDEINRKGSGGYVLEVSGSSGTITEEQFQALITNFPNISVLVTTLEGMQILINSFILNEGLYIGTASLGLTYVYFYLSSDLTWTFELEDKNSEFVPTGKGNNTAIYGALELHGDQTYLGNVDFSEANVTGLGTGGGLTKTKVTLAELQALITAENMGMLVSIICKNSSKRNYNGVVAPMLKIGYSTLSTNAPEVFNRYIYSISDSFYNGASVIQFNEYLLRISKSGVILNNYIYRINKTTLEFTTSTETLKTDLTDSNFDFYVYK